MAKHEAQIAVPDSKSERFAGMAHTGDGVMSDTALDVLEVIACSVADLGMAEPDHIDVVEEAYEAMEVVAGSQDNRDKAVVVVAAAAQVVLKPEIPFPDRKKNCHAFEEETPKAEAFEAKPHSVVKLIWVDLEGQAGNAVD